MNPKLLLLVFIQFLVMETGCKKSATTPTPAPPPPNLTGKMWTLDTITINLPATFSGLSTDQKFSYQSALAWSKGAELTFNADGTMITGGDWDFGYQKWRLVNNNAGIEVTLVAGKDTLRSWFADGTKFTYVSPLNGAFDCTYIYK